MAPFMVWATAIQVYSPLDQMLLNTACEISLSFSGHIGNISKQKLTGKDTPLGIGKALLILACTRAALSLSLYANNLDRVLTG